MDSVEWCGRGAAPREAVEDNTMAIFIDIKAQSFSAVITQR